jgi:hypothetical protein
VGPRAILDTVVKRKIPSPLTMYYVKDKIGCLQASAHKDHDSRKQCALKMLICIESDETFLDKLFF